MVEKQQHGGWWPEFFEPLRSAGERLSDWFSPRSDASTGDQSYEINLELPGVKPEDIDIHVHDGVMTVKGEKKLEKTEEKAGYFFSERQYGQFQRTFRLPADAGEDGINADFTDGVLKITVPKTSPAAPKVKKVTVSKG